MTFFYGNQDLKKIGEKKMRKRSAQVPLFCVLMISLQNIFVDTIWEINMFTSLEIAAFICDNHDLFPCYIKTQTLKTTISPTNGKMRKTTKLSHFNIILTESYLIALLQMSNKIDLNFNKTLQTNKMYIFLTFITL